MPTSPRFTVVLVLLVALGCGERYELPPAPGSIEGRIHYDGPPVDRITSGESTDPNCPSEIDITPVAVNNDGTLRNTYVYLREGVENAPAPPEANNTAVVRTRECQYDTRLLAIRRGQSVFFDDTGARTLHNPHPLGIYRRVFAAGPLPGPRNTVRFKHTFVAEQVRCDVHKWMVMYVAVLDHPFYDVTGNEGSFRLNSVPAGEYTIASWHESLGELTRTVRVEPGETSIMNFVYSPEEER